MDPTRTALDFDYGHIVTNPAEEEVPELPEWFEALSRCCFSTCRLSARAAWWLASAPRLTVNFIEGGRPAGLDGDSRNGLL
jgi:hypothetical protein